MHRFRRNLFLALLSVVITPLLAACGGGSSSPPEPPVPPQQQSGIIVENDRLQSGGTTVNIWPIRRVQIFPTGGGQLREYATDIRPEDWQFFFVPAGEYEVHVHYLSAGGPFIEQVTVSAGEASRVTFTR